jgi:hypothetical protein
VCAGVVAGEVEDAEEVGWCAGVVGCGAGEVGAVADGPPMGYRAPLDLVMASVVELVKRSALVMKTQTWMKIHLVLP